MKTLQKILVLCLAAALMLGLFACGKKAEENKQDDAKAPAGAVSDEVAQQIVESAPGTFTIVADSHVTLGYNENGKALALSGENELGVSIANACGDVSGKTVAEAVTVVLQTMVENDAIVEKPYVMIRQDLGSMTPDEEFISGIQAAATKELGKSVVVVSLDQLDADGYFNQDVAKQILLAYLGGDAKIISASVMIDGQYIITAEKDGLQDDYQVVGHSGTVAGYEEIADRPIDEEDLIPEDQQIPTPDEDVIEEAPSEDEPPEETPETQIPEDENIG